eukprot:TRINITY_DN1128_c0_g2_i1.p1 TRINITY_DN1128_c0_g2~~TRINITY_DN1128_c0_g2_i1.p1  ORF type:complete len:477 (-),score=33.26 TRINITY_DN1128_c0_g2_i1:126-1556(-)
MGGRHSNEEPTPIDSEEPEAKHRKHSNPGTSPSGPGYSPHLAFDLILSDKKKCTRLFPIPNKRDTIGREARALMLKKMNATMWNDYVGHTVLVQPNGDHGILAEVPVELRATAAYVFTPKEKAEEFKIEFTLEAEMPKFPFTRMSTPHDQLSNEDIRSYLAKDDRATIYLLPRPPRTDVKGREAREWLRLELIRAPDLWKTYLNQAVGVKRNAKNNFETVIRPPEQANEVRRMLYYFMPNQPVALIRAVGVLARGGVSAGKDEIRAHDTKYWVKTTQASPFDIRKEPESDQHFVVDSGAEVCVIPLTIAQDYLYKHSGDGGITFYSGEAVFQVPGLPAIRALTQAHKGFKHDYLLGMSFLKCFSWAFNGTDKPMTIMVDGVASEPPLPPKGFCFFPPAAGAFADETHPKGEAERNAGMLSPEDAAKAAAAAATVHRVLPRSAPCTTSTPGPAGPADLPSLASPTSEATRSKRHRDV